MDQVLKIKKAKDRILVIVKGQLMKKERDEIAAYLSHESALIFYRSILDGKPA